MFLSHRGRENAPNILTTIGAKAKERQLAGEAVYNLSIGTPDLPPDPHVMNAVKEAALNPDNYKYSLGDSLELLAAVKNWYDRRFNVELNNDNICGVYGTQEGMAHIFFTLCNPGDIVIVPTPAYPVFLSGIALAGAVPYFVPMKKENNYLVDFGDIPVGIAEKAKAIVISYPNNPTTATANDDFYERLIHFAKKHNIFVIHDNAYCELILSGRSGKSFLEYKGAFDIGIEFNSLSKSYNLTGLRSSFALGNKSVIESFKGFRTQIDYGVFKVVQKGAVAALNGPQDILERNRIIYRERRDVLTQGLRSIGWQVEDTDSTMFTWYSIPEKFNDDKIFAVELLSKSGVAIVPGSSFGNQGKGYVRLALVESKEQLLKGISAIKNSGILKR